MQRNKYYNYDGIELWEGSLWKERALPVDNLIQWLGQLDSLEETEYPLPAGIELDLNQAENGFIGYVPPDEQSYWEGNGYSLEIHHIWVAKWISLSPRYITRGSGTLVPAVVVMHQEHIRADWAAKTLKKIRGLADAAAQRGMVFLAVVTDGPDITSQYANILMEAASLYPIDTDRIFLDVTAVYTTGHLLRETPGGVKYDYTGKVWQGPDACAMNLESSRLLNISGICKGRGSPNQFQLAGFGGKHGGNADYDPGWILHTPAAQRDVEALRLEYSFASDDEEGFLTHLSNMGLEYKAHDYRHEKYVTLAPRSVLENGKEKLPAILVFQEVYYYNPHLSIEAVAYWYEYCKIAAQGECMLIFYACEAYEHNKNMRNVFLDACREYPIDRTRVYVTGYSHNSKNAVRFAYDNSDIVTAIAGGLPGMMSPGISDEEQERVNAAQARIDMPCVCFAGMNEHTSPLGNPSFASSGPAIKIKKNAFAAGNCVLPKEEDFQAAFASTDKATRMVGVPNDRSETLYLEGLEHYICDVKNKNGKWHLRFGAIQGAPHNPFPTKQILEWSFIRRFARDTDSHEITELY